jgi:hypothetical protein
MHVHLGPYRGFAVNRFDPIAPPNPRCCSDPKILCPKCAVAVLRDEGFTTNCDSAPSYNAEALDAEAEASLMDPPPLTFNIEDEQPEIVYDDTDLMQPPELDFSAMVHNRQQREQRKLQSPDRASPVVNAGPDELALMDAPQINWRELAGRSAR